MYHTIILYIDYPLYVFNTTSFIIPYRLPVSCVSVRWEAVGNCETDCIYNALMSIDIPPPACSQIDQPKFGF